MSRLNELKKQYPEFTMSFFDLFVKLDTSKSYKYLPLICKIFATRLDPKKNCHLENYSSFILEMNNSLIIRGVDTKNLKATEMLILQIFADTLNWDSYEVLVDFMNHMENNRIENKDVTSYNNVDDLRKSITLASMKQWSKDLEKQVIKEFEDDTWVIVRPLTFSSSIKYGSGTKWCTTSMKDKKYFEKYWRRGILVYCINKTTGYKFAGFKALDGENELSFWNAEDSRVDFLELEISENLYPILKSIFKSDSTNKNLCSPEVQEQVHQECLPADYEKDLLVMEELLQNEINYTRTMTANPAQGINLNYVVPTVSPEI